MNVTIEFIQKLILHNGIVNYQWAEKCLGKKAKYLVPTVKKPNEKSLLLFPVFFDMNIMKGT